MLDQWTAVLRFRTGLVVALLAGLVARLTPQREDASFAAFYLVSLGLGVLLVSLRKGVLGEEAAALLGAAILTAAVGLAGLLAATGLSVSPDALAAAGRVGPQRTARSPAVAADPADAMARKVALVPEDRLGEAAFLDMTVRENTSITVLRRFWRRLYLSPSAERRSAERLISTFGIRTPGAEATLGSLSGGNQQKAILARWLQREPKLLLLDEPSQGVDVVARAEISAHVVAAVRHLAERHDGTGGPDRLAGDDIPLISQMVAAADALEQYAMASIGDEAGPTEAVDRALGLISAQRGTLFRPEIVDTARRQRERIIAICADGANTSDDTRNAVA